MPILAAYAEPIVETGVLGSALEVKLINSLLFAANAQLVAAAIALGDHRGVDSARLLNALAVCSDGSDASAYVGRMGGPEAFEAGAGPYLREDIALVLSMAGQDADLGCCVQLSRADCASSRVCVDALNRMERAGMAKMTS